MDAIVFDWDGTLVDSLPAIFDANLRVLAEYGLPFDDARYRAAYVPDWRVMYQRLGVPDDALDAAGARWLELYRDDRRGGAPAAGRRVARSGCRRAGFVMGLVTAGRSRRRRAPARAVRARRAPAGAGLRQRRRSPRSRTRTRCCASLRELDRAERIATARYVGDVPDDMRMARAVGALGIGIESSIGIARRAARRRRERGLPGRGGVRRRAPRAGPIAADGQRPRAPDRPRAVACRHPRRRRRPGRERARRGLARLGRRASRSSSPPTAAPGTRRRSA